MSSKQKEWETDYSLIPMNEITEEAREIAVRWVEGYEPKGFDLPGKHKLASDIMNYARRSRGREIEELKKDLVELMKINKSLKKALIEKTGTSF